MDDKNNLRTKNGLIAGSHRPSNDVELVLECLPNPAIVLGTDYRILAANASYRALYSFEDGPINKHCYEVSHGYSVPCDMAGESCPLRESQRRRETSRVLHIHHTPRGEEYVNVEMWPVIDPQTKDVRFFIEQMHPSTAGFTEAEPNRLVGRSPAFQEMLGLVERAAPSNTTVMLLGESGTGKELVAQTLHRLSDRGNQPFVPVECTGLPESLFESELFGHTKGAFTGATSHRTGLVAAAQGGTLFLDEVGDIPLTEQVKLLRLLETRRYRPVGSSEQRASDFRLICATNKNLRALVDQGAFREDLYYRLNVFEIELPPLRDRPEDLEPLIQTLLGRLEAPNVRFDQETIGYLRQYQFPGNVRELRNIIERAILLAGDETVHPQHLPKHCTTLNSPQTPVAQGATTEVIPLDEAERRYLRQVIRTNYDDRKQLAHKLGISERALYRKLAALRSE